MGLRSGGERCRKRRIRIGVAGSFGAESGVEGAFRAESCVDGGGFLSRVEGVSEMLVRGIPERRAVPKE